MIDDSTTVPSGKKPKKEKKPRKPFTFFKRLRKEFIVAIVCFVVIVASIGTAAYFYNKYKQIKQNPVSAVQEKNSTDAERVLKKITSVLLVTDSDKPTVARVSDAAKLKSSNDFYKNVENDDYLAIYPKRIIIYRESNNQIINVAPIVSTPTSGNNSTTTGTNPAGSTTPKN